MHLRVLRALGQSLMLLLAASAGAQTPLPASARPEVVGLSSERLERIRRAIQADVDAGQIPGAVIAIARRGKLAYFKAFGYRDKSRGLPMTTDTLFDLTSMTKPFVSVAALMLYERGSLFLSDPVSKYLPSLEKMPVAVMHMNASTGEEEPVMRTDVTGHPAIETVVAVRQMTIQDLMRHTSGLTYGVWGETAVHKLYPSISYDLPGLMTETEFIDKLATLPLLHQPGTQWDYGFSTDVLGIVIEKITKQSLGDYLKANVFRPLGLDACFRLSDEQANRYARPLPADPVTGKSQSTLDLTKPLKFDCGGACAASTAGGYLRFAQMLLNGGRIGSARILGRKTVEYMTTDQLGPEVRGINPLGPEPDDAGYGFGLGVAVRRRVGSGTTPGSEGEYSWTGAYGTQFWVDPKEKLVVVFMMAARGPTVSRYRQLIRTLVLQAIDYE